MGWYDESRNDDSEDEAEFLSVLVDRGEFSGVTEGIVKRVIDKGQNALSDKQRAIFDRDVQPHLKRRCGSCDESIPVSELAEALDNGGYCSWCTRPARTDG